MRVRRTVAAAVAATALVVTTACGGSESSGGESSDDTGGTHSVSGVLGGTVDGVPDNPERVVSLWTTSTQLLDLGIEPVGILEDTLVEDRVTPEQWDALKDLPTVGTFDNLDVEKIASLEPDLIVGLTNGFMTEKDIKPFQELGIPTLTWEVEEPPDVWANYPDFAKAIGETTDYERHNAELNAELADIEKEFGDKVGDTQWASVRGGGDATQFVLDTDQSLAYERISAAGATFPGFLTDLGQDARYALELSYEKLPDLAKADALFYEAGPDGEPTDVTQPLVEHELWKKLPAVRDGNAFPLSQTFNYTFDGQQQMIDDIRAAFEQYEPAD